MVYFTIILYSYEHILKLQLNDFHYNQERRKQEFLNKMSFHL